jgi:hypothetical protein
MGVLKEQEPKETTEEQVFVSSVYSVANDHAGIQSPATCRHE